MRAAASSALFYNKLIDFTQQLKVDSKQVGPRRLVHRRSCLATLAAGAAAAVADATAVAVADDANVSLSNIP